MWGQICFPFISLDQRVNSSWVAYWASLETKLYFQGKTGKKCSQEDDPEIHVSPTAVLTPRIGFELVSYARRFLFPLSVSYSHQNQLRQSSYSTCFSQESFFIFHKAAAAVLPLPSYSRRFFQIRAPTLLNFSISWREISFFKLTVTAQCIKLRGPQDRDMSSPLPLS